MPVSVAALRDHTTRAVAGVERVQDAGRAKRVDAAVAERRRRARTGAAIRFPEPDRVAMSPHRLAGGHPVAGDDLVVAALLLGVEQVAAHRERRPAWSDRPAPHLDRRRLRPVGLDPHAANDAVAVGSAKAGPVSSGVSVAAAVDGSSSAAFGGGAVACDRCWPAALRRCAAGRCCGRTAALFRSLGRCRLPAAAAAARRRPARAAVPRASCVQRQRDASPRRR